MLGLRGLGRVAGLQGPRPVRPESPAVQVALSLSAQQPLVEVGFLHRIIAGTLEHLVGALQQSDLQRHQLIVDGEPVAGVLEEG